jgi:hypothetical protein
MKSINKKSVIKGIILVTGGLLFAAIVAFITIARTWGRTIIQVDIHQNKELIHLSTFAEPPQFAIWLESPGTNEEKTVFVTHRVAVGDWEGKANVPVALPEWFRKFKSNGNRNKESGSFTNSGLTISGATPKEDFFSIRVEVKPGSEWICWIEMNLAGDFNEAFPEIDRESHMEDEFSNGQPALLFKADVKAIENTSYKPELFAQSIWNNDSVKIEPVGDGITTARNVFDTIRISVNKPKPRLIDKYKIKDF